MYRNQRTKLGFIGIGLMGKPMVLRLLMADYDVHVWNRSPNKLTEIIAAGAIACESPAAVAKASDVLLMCLANTAVVQQVVQSDGFVDALDHKTIIDLSSISPQVTQELSTLVGSRPGCQWIDAPVSGGVAGAEQGSLVVMAGGDGPAIDTIRPILAALSQRVTHMGPSGAGQTTKLCNQIIVGCNITAISESIRLAKQAGVDANLLPAALAGGFADSLPFQIFGARMAADEETPVSIKLETMLKDLHGAIEAAHQSGIELQLTDSAADILSARVNAGDAERCITSLVEPVS